VIDAVLLIAFGGPTAPHEIRPFLENVTRGRRIAPERLEEVAHHYERMPGGRSPLNELTLAQARALADALASAGTPLAVHVGMRNWHPYLHETLAHLAETGAKRCLGIIMSSLRCEASWDRYQADVAEARARTPGAPEVVFARPWSTHRGFLNAVADRAQQALAQVPEEARAWTPLVFTAHSIPLAMAEASPYLSDFTTAARAVAERLRHPWSLAYQSRSGRPEDPWLGPDINDVLASVAADGERHAVVVPIGFACDHVEVLYDLDIEAATRAREHGLTVHRAEALNVHPAFIEALADIVKKTT
jgi:ferrochelatase